MSELEYTAYHEAGHAVIAVMMGGVVHRVSIIPSDDDGPNRFGETSVAWPLAGVQPSDHTLREIKTALAGPAAEAVYRDSDDAVPLNHESSADWLAASLHSQRLSNDNGLQLALLRETAAQLVDLFRHDERVWSAVAAVADQLLTHETLEPNQVEEVVAFWLR